MTPEEHLGRLLTRRGWRIAVAETTAGGLVSHRLVSVPGSSAYFDLGLIPYSRASKLGLPGVTEALLDRFGAVSPEIASALAEGVRRLAGVEVGLAETGIAGPARRRSPKPVGTVHVALATPAGNCCSANLFSGDRTEIQRRIAQFTLDEAVEALLRRIPD
jgi:PncC family amidohydrolase